MKILEYRDAVARERGAHLVVVLLGNNNTFGDRLLHDIPQPWTLLESRLRERKIAFVNTADSLSAYYRNDPDTVINAFGVHYTPFAHDKVARLVVESGVLERELERRTEAPLATPSEQ